MIRRLIVVLIGMNLLACKSNIDHSISDALLHRLIHDNKEKLSHDWGYESVNDELNHVWDQFHADLEGRVDFDSTALLLNSWLELNKKASEVFDIHPRVDSLYQLMNSSSISFDTKKYICFQLIEHQCWREKSMVFNHSWKIRLLNADTVYIPSKRQKSYYYMLLNPLHDTIRATDLNYGSILGDIKTVNLYADYEPGTVYKEVIELPVTHTRTDEVIVFRDTVLVKVFED